MEWWESMDKKELYEWGKYWMDNACKSENSSKYYQQQLVDAHALLGRITHQLSERWDSVNLTKHFPTDNLHGKRSCNNPTGE